MKIQLTLGSLALAGAAMANTVVPGAYANLDANGSFVFLVEGNSSRTYQTIIGANQLTGLIGSNLTGLAWRLDTAAVSPWPATGGTMSNFQIRLGNAVAPNAISGTYANNFVGASTLVRSGELTIDANSFGLDGEPNAWAPSIGFDSPFLYNGGNLLVEYRFTGMPTGSGQPRLDAVASGASGHMSDFSAAWGFGDFETTALHFGANAPVLVTQFSAAPVPEPATMAILGAGAFGLIRRRRRSARA